MQFVLFEVVATRQTLIALIWRKYGARTWKWIGLKVALFVGFVILCAALFAPFFITILRHTRHAAPNAPTMNFVLSMLGFILALAALIVIFIVALYQTLDFVLPVMALENGSVSAGMHRLGLIWRHEPGQMLLYLLLRLVLGVAFGIGVMAVMLFGILLPLIPLGGVGFVLWYALHAQGLAGHILLIGAAAIGGLILLCWIVLLYIATVGFVMTFHQAYALYFLGGRYPMLGNLIEPPSPVYPYAPPPPSFQPITPPPPEPAV